MSNGKSNFCSNVALIMIEKVEILSDAPEIRHILLKWPVCRLSPSLEAITIVNFDRGKQDFCFSSQSTSGDCRSIETCVTS